MTEIVSPEGSPEVLAELQPMLIAARAMPPIDYSQPFDQIRELAAQGAEAFRMFFEPVPEMDEVYDTEIDVEGGSITLRVYQPTDATNAPCLVYFHGGGWVLGDLDGSDAMCKKIADAAGMVVVSVDYRLAPEHPHPIPMEDCYAAVALDARARRRARHRRRRHLDRRPVRRRTALRRRRAVAPRPRGPAGARAMAGRPGHRPHARRRASR